MHWFTGLALGAVACGLAGCTQTDEIAFIPAVAEETDPFAARVKNFYYHRLAEQPPLPVVPLVDADGN